jgi:hypothetical protein
MNTLELPSAVYATAPAAHLSSGYGFIPTSDIVDAFSGEGWVVTRGSAAKPRKPERQGLQKHLLRFARIDDLANRNVGSERMEMVVINGHDGTSALRMTAGVFRFACANGIVVSTSTVADVRFGHHKLTMDKVLDAGHTILGQTSKVIDVIDSWKSIGVSMDDAMHLAEQGAVLRWGVDRATHPVGPQTLLDLHRDEDRGLTLWNAFNRIQENLTRGGQRDTSRFNRATNRSFRATRGIKNIQADMKVNMGLWEAATEVASRANFVG